MRIRCLLVVSTLLLFPAAALAQAPQLWDPAYTIRHWTTDDGLPTNAVLSVAHDTDDFLWLATNDGLVRFNGIQMEVFNRSTTEALPVNRFDAIHTDTEGRLTFSSRQRHFVQYHNRSFHHFPSTTRGTAVRVEADSIWLGTEAGLRLLTHTTDQPYRPDAIRTHVSGIVRDGDGFLWVATRGQGLVRLAPNGNAHTFTHSDGLPEDDILDLYPAPDGSLWLLTRSTLVQYTAGTFHQRATLPRHAIQSVAEGARVLRLPTLHVDTAGRVWIRNNAWLPSEALHNETRAFVWTPETNTLTPWNANDGTQARIRTLATDAAGTTWLVEHRDRRSALYRGRTRFADLPTLTNALHLKNDGILWVATGSGLYQIRPRPVQALVPRFTEGRGFLYALVEAPDGTLSAPVPNQRRLMHITPEGVTTEALPGIFYRTIFLTRDGTRWLGGDLCRYDQGTCTPVQAGPEYEPLRGVIAALEDRSGRFWIGTHNALWEGRTDQPPEQWRKHPLPGLTSGDRIQILYETPDGELLAGTQLSGMARVIHQHLPTRFAMTVSPRRMV